MSYQWNSVNNHPKPQPIYSPNQQNYPQYVQYPSGPIYPQPIYYDNNGYAQPVYQNGPMAAYPTTNFYAPNPSPQTPLSHSAPNLSSQLYHSNIVGNNSNSSVALPPTKTSTVLPQISSETKTPTTENNNQNQGSRRRDRFSSYLQSDRLLSFFRSGETAKKDQPQSSATPTTSSEVKKENEIPFAISCDGSSSGYFAYEMENNPMIKELKGKLANDKSFIQRLASEGGILLVPQENSLKNTIISDSFLNTHAITLLADSDEGSMWKSFNNFMISIDSKREGVFLIELGDLHSSKKAISQSTSSPLGIADNNNNDNKDEGNDSDKKSIYNLPPTHITTTNGVSIPRVQILREGQVQFTSPVGLILISEPIFTYPEDFQPSTPDRTPAEEKTKAKEAKEEEDLTYQEIYKQKIMHIKAKKLRTDIKDFIKKFLNNLPPEKDRPKIVLSFITIVMDSMKVHPLWADSSEAELEIARDNIQKTIFKQVISKIFTSPAVKKKNDQVSKIIDSLWFVSPEHLDIDTNDWDESVWHFAKKELELVNTLLLPKEKIQCVLNCSKIIIYLLNSKGGVAGADDFLPHLIFAVLYSNPPNLYCNIEFIKQYCICTDELSEAFYYLTILESVVYFIENISAQSLFMDEELFNKFMSGEIPRGPRPLHKYHDLNQILDPNNHIGAPQKKSPQQPPNTLGNDAGDDPHNNNDSDHINEEGKKEEALNIDVDQKTNDNNDNNNNNINSEEPSTDIEINSVDTSENTPALIDLNDSNIIFHNSSKKLQYCNEEADVKNDIITPQINDNIHTGINSTINVQNMYQNIQREFEESNEIITISLVDDDDEEGNFNPENNSNPLIDNDQFDKKAIDAVNNTEALHNTIDLVDINNTLLSNINDSTNASFNLNQKNIIDISFHNDEVNTKRVLSHSTSSPVIGNAMPIPSTPFITPPTAVPIQPIVTPPVDKDYQRVKDTINFIATSIKEIPPTYVNYQPEELMAVDIPLLLTEYRHMANMLNIVAALQNCVNKK